MSIVNKLVGLILAIVNNSTMELGDNSTPMVILQGIHNEGSRENIDFVLSPINLSIKGRETVLVPNPLIGPIHDYNLIGSINSVLCLQRIVA